MKFFDFRMMPYSEVIELNSALFVYLINLLHQFVLSIVQIVNLLEFLVEQRVHSLQLSLQVKHSILQLFVSSRFLQLFQVFLAIQFELLRELSLPSLELSNFLFVIVEICLRSLRLQLRQLQFKALYFLSESGVFQFNELPVLFIVVSLCWLNVPLCLKSPQFLLKLLVKRSGIIVSSNELLVNSLMPLQFHLIGCNHSLGLYLFSQQSLVVFSQLLIVLLVFAYCMLQLLVQLFALLKLVVRLLLHEVKCLLPLHLHCLLHLLEFSLGKLGFKPFCSQNELLLFSLQASNCTSQLF